MNSNARCWRILLLVLGLLAFAFASRAHADLPHFDAATVGPGPLLFFCSPAEPRPGERVEESFVFDPESELPPQRVWHGNVPIPQPVCRLSADSLVLSFRGCLYRLELSTGQAKPLLPSGAKTEFVAVDGSTVFFLEKLRDRTHYGYQLERRAGVMTVGDYDRPRDRLYSLDVKPSSKPVLLCDREIERVISHDAQHFYVITAGDNRKLVSIDKNAKCRDLLPIDPHWVVPSTNSAFSPGGIYLGLTFIHDAHSFGSERELLVVNIAKGTETYAQACVKISSLTADSAVPNLSIRWLDEKHLSFGWETPKVVDAEVGRDLDPKTATQLLQKFPPPQHPKRTTLGDFDLEFGLVYFKADAKPVASTLDKDGVQVRNLSVSPNGDFAAFVGVDDGKTYLVDGKKKEKRVLLPQWSYELQWLPATQEK